MTQDIDDNLSPPCSTNIDRLLAVGSQKKDMSRAKKKVVATSRSHGSAPASHQDGFDDQHYRGSHSLLDEKSTLLSDQTSFYSTHSTSCSFRPGDTRRPKRSLVGNLVSPSAFSQLARIEFNVQNKLNYLSESIHTSMESQACMYCISSKPMVSEIDEDRPVINFHSGTMIKLPTKESMYCANDPSLSCDERSAIKILMGCQDGSPQDLVYYEITPATQGSKADGANDDTKNIFFWGRILLTLLISTGTGLIVSKCDLEGKDQVSRYLLVPVSFQKGHLINLCNAENRASKKLRISEARLVRNNILEQPITQKQQIDSSKEPVLTHVKLDESTKSCPTTISLPQTSPNITWNQFIGLLQNCLLKNDSSPYEIVKNYFLRLNFIVGDDSFTLYTIKSVEVLEAILRHLTADKSVLLTKVDIIGRVHSYCSQKVETEEYNSNAADGILRLLQLQVLLRLQLYSMISSNANEIMASFLNLYCKYLVEKKKKRKNSSAAFYKELFIADLCSILELAHFVIPPTHSFSDFVQFLSSRSSDFDRTTVNTVLEFFEISSDSLEEAVEHDKENNGSQSEMKGNALNESDQISVEALGKKQEMCTHFVGTGSISSQVMDELSSVQEEELTVVDSSMKSTSNAGRKMLVTREKYVGNHFSDKIANLPDLFREVRMVKIPPPGNVVNPEKKNDFNFAKCVEVHHRIVKETPVKNKPTCSQRSESLSLVELYSMSPGGRRECPSELVATVMRRRSKGK